MNKADFPIFTKHPTLVYLDNSATTQKPQVVLDAIEKFYTESNANVHRGIHDLAEKATQAYENSRNIVARFLNATLEEIVFTSGTTESINLISNSLRIHFRKERRKSILLTEMEHHSNILPWQMLASELGWDIKYVKINQEFRLDIQDLKNKLSNSEIAIFAYTHTSNVLGTTTDAGAVNQIVRSISPETLIVMDGAQFVPHSKPNVAEIDTDFYVFSGHKMLGPTGIGVLYGKKLLLERLTPAKQGGGMIEKVEYEKSTFAQLPEKFEAGTPNISGAIALSKAIEYIEGSSDDFDKIYQLGQYFLKKSQEIDEMTIFGPKDMQNRAAVFSFTLEGIHAHDIAQILNEKNIAIRAGHHCTQILHRNVLKVPATARASVYVYNDEGDIEKFFLAIKNAISIFKQ